MFKIDRVPLEEIPNESQLSCELVPRKTHLCVRPVCCTSHEMWAGIDVHLCSTEAALTADKKVRVGETDYGVVATQATKDTGWAHFKDASEHKDKTLAVWVEAPDYHPRYALETSEENRQEEAAKRKQPVACTVTLTEEAHTVVQAVMRSEVPILPPDFDDKVSAMVSHLKGVRLLVDHGPNLGNQSAALSLLQNLRRAGYKGPIQVLVDSYAMIEQWDLQLKFEIPTTEPDLAKASERAKAIQQKLLHRYEGTTAETLQNRDWFKKIKLGDEEVVFTMDPGEELRLARCFQDLPFAYTLSEPTWGSLDKKELKGRTPPPEEEVLGNLIVLVEVSLQTAGEESLDAKLKRLDPSYDKVGEYKDVTWIKKEGDGSLPAFDSDVSDDDTIVGMVAGGEAGEGAVDTYRKDKTKTHSLIAIQPLLWHPENRFFQIKGKAATRLCLPEAAAYFIDEIAPDDRLAMMKGQIDEEKATAIDAVLSAVGTCDLMVAYGVHQARSSSPLVVLDNLACSLVKAIAEGHLKKTLLFVLCKAGVELPLVHEKVIRAGVDSELSDKISGLKDDEVLFIHSPPLPQRTFQLLAQAGTLPFLLEGANTCNLMQMLGKPYLSVCTQTTPYVEVPGKTGHQGLQALTDHLNASGGSSDTRVGALAGYFKDAKNAGAVLGGYFPALKSHVKRKPLDQVKWALYRLKKAMEDKAVPSSEQCCPTK